MLYDQDGWLGGALPLQFRMATLAFSSLAGHDGQMSVLSLYWLECYSLPSQIRMVNENALSLQVRLDSISLKDG